MSLPVVPLSVSKSEAASKQLSAFMLLHSLHQGVELHQMMVELFQWDHSWQSSYDPHQALTTS